MDLTPNEAQFFSKGKDKSSRYPREIWRMKEKVQTCFKGEFIVQFSVDLMFILNVFPERQVKILMKIKLTYFLHINWTSTELEFSRAEKFSLCRPVKVREIFADC